MKCIKQGNIGNNETADMQESSKAVEWGTLKIKQRKRKEPKLPVN